jgi:2-methylcitrate dehydratase PrpD
MVETLTRALGTFVSSLRLEAAPAGALDAVHTGFTDCVATMIAGSAEEPPKILLRTLAPGPGDATLYLSGPRIAALEAAFIDAVAAHALDFDDVALKGHPSAVLVPAILAEGESLGASGERLATAYLAGYEVWADLAFRDPAHLHEKGWHPTGVFGPIAAAAACASLRGLDASQAAHAIALGASQSAGLVANFGSMTKPFHAGRASHAGVLAARLAAAGFTASLDALEHPLGFLAAVSPGGKADRSSATHIGREWNVLRHGLGVKKYPLCYCTHRALDGVLDLLRTRPVAAKDVKSVTVSTSRRNAAVLRNASPRTGLEAKFSMQFAMACAIAERRAGLAELTDSVVQRADIQDLMRKVVVVPDDRQDPARSGSAPYDQVVIETLGGARLESAQVTDERGSPQLPLSREELWAKFEGCLAAGKAGVAAAPLFEALMTLERQSGVGALTRAAGAASEPRESRARLSVR